MRPMTSRAVAVIVGTLGLVVVAIVARARPSHPFAASTPRSQVTVPPKTVAINTASLSNAPRHHDGGIPRSGSDLALIVVIAVVVLVVVLLIRGLAGVRFRLLRRGSTTGRQVDVAPPTGATRVPDSVTEAVDAGLDLMTARGPVSDVVIQAWIRVEQALGAAGMHVRASETSTEFVDRALRGYGVRERELRRLSELYREARFSTHALDEDDRLAAQECLARIRDDLGGARHEA